MRHVPKLFKPEMVRKILADQKDVTRRPVKNPAITFLGGANDDRDDPHLWGWEDPNGDFAVLGRNPDEDFLEYSIRCPHGEPGDLLYVRETWAPADRFYQGHDLDTPRVVAYLADRSAINWSSETPRAVPDSDIAQWNWKRIKWRPNIHMSKWMARIWLRATSVRVERVQAITADEVLREGIEVPDVDYSVMDDPRRLEAEREAWARQRFAELWDGMYGKGPLAWEHNPFTWVVDFERAEAPQEAG